MKQIKKMAHITNTDSKIFLDTVNSYALNWQEQGYELEVTYTSTTPYGANTEYQAFIVARGN